MKISAPSHVQFSRRLTAVPLGMGLETVEKAKDEVHYMLGVVLGREDAPVDSPYLGLMEVASAYFARGLEIEMLIHDAEREGLVEKGSDWYRFRTGTLRSFIDAMKRMAELGSRRLTQETLLTEQRLDAGA